MLKFVLMLPVFVILVVVSAAPAQDLLELKVAKVEIVPHSAVDSEGAFFRGRPIIEAAPVPEKGSEPLELPMYRSYRFIVTVEYVGGRAPSSCLVRTECVRDGKTVTLGKARIIYDPAPRACACYHVYSSTGGPGDCLIRTIVEPEPEGRPGGFLEFRARIVE